MGLFGFGKKDKKEDVPSASNDSAAVDPAQQKLLAEEKNDMIKGIEDLSETSVKEVMVPRIDVDFISIETPQEELLQKVTASGHSRFPVYSGSIDNVVGVLYVKDLIAAFSRHEQINLEKIIRKAYFVPESKRIDSLLREFKRRHLHIAIAIDEYGGISGIVCMEDIIEEIVGDIQDEYDQEEAEMTRLPDGSYEFDGLVLLDEATDLLQIDLSEQEEDTLGGYVFGLLGRRPEIGDKVNIGDYSFEVLRTKGFRVVRLRAQKRPQASLEGEE